MIPRSREQYYEYDPKLDSLVGIPFVDRGRTTDGCDCWGGVIIAGEILGFDIPDYGDYHHKDGEGISGEVQRRLPDWDKVDKPEIGDVAMYKLPGGILHFSIIIGKRYMFHVNDALGGDITRFKDEFYTNCLIGYYRLRKAQR